MAKTNFHKDPKVAAELERLQILRTALVNLQQLPASARPAGAQVAFVLADMTSFNIPASIPKVECLIKRTTNKIKTRVQAMGADELALVGEIEANNFKLNMPFPECRAAINKTTEQIMATIDSHRLFKPAVNFKSNRVDTFVEGHQRAARRAQAKQQAKEAK